MNVYVLSLMPLLRCTHIMERAYFPGMNTVSMCAECSVQIKWLTFHKTSIAVLHIFHMLHATCCMPVPIYRFKETIDQQRKKAGQHWKMKIEQNKIWKVEKKREKESMSERNKCKTSTNGTHTHTLAHSRLQCTKTSHQYIYCNAIYFLLCVDYSHFLGQYFSLSIAFFLFRFRFHPLPRLSSTKMNATSTQR